jgi:hypothetical protein
MPNTRLWPRSTPSKTQFKQWGQQRVGGDVRRQQAGNTAAPARVNPRQVDRFEAAPARANGPVLQPNQPNAFTSTGSSNVQSQIDTAARSRDWKKTAPLMQQTTLDNCGPAAVAMLARSAGSYGEQHLGDEELIRRIGSGYLNRAGPGGVQVNDMGFMMNNAGLVIDSASAPKGAEVEGYVKDRLLSGQKMLALLDGHMLQGTQGAGASPHWVVIDGVDSNGQFVVKDPALGKALSVNGATLRASLESGERATGASGLLAVEPKTQFGADRNHGLLNGAAGMGSRPMNNGKGVGTRTASASGSREST